MRKADQREEMMSIATRMTDTERRVYLALTDTAHHLTGRDLQRITEITRQVRAIVHIRYGSWQVLVSVPEIEYQNVERALKAAGYEARILSGKIYERSTFVLKGRVNGETCGPACPGT